MSAELVNQNSFFDSNNFISGKKEIQQTQENSRLLPKKTAAKDFYVAPVIRFAFYGFIATIPFETVNLGVPVELTAISLGILLISLIFQPSLCLRIPTPAYLCFLLYLIVFGLPVYISTPRIFFDEAQWQLFVVLQLMLMSWVAFNVMKSERAARGALITLGIACTILAVLQQLGISQADTGESASRSTAFGFHPNNIARIFALGLLALAGLTYAIPKSHFKSRLWVLGAIALIGIAVVQTGSRGALLALAAGLIIFVFKDGAVSTKIRNAAIVVIAIVFFVVLVFQSEVSSSRFESAVEDGKFARREQIYPLAWKMFVEKPLYGWGAKVGEYELGARIAHPEEDSKNPHNLILFVFISTGLIGAIPLFYGIWLAVRICWKTRHGVRGVLPLSMLTMVLVANMSGVWLHNKMHWFVMAYALSSAYALPKKVWRRNGG